MPTNTKSLISLPKRLLWEYDLGKFDYDKSYFIVIERVIRRGDILLWRMVQNYYGIEKMLEVAEKSRQLNARDKHFTRLYVNSKLNDPYRRTDYQAGNIPAFTEATKR